MDLPKTGLLVRGLLIILPLVLVLTLVSLFMPVQQVSIEGIGTLSFETTITLSVGSEVAYAASEWRSPTGFVDGGSVWTDEPKAYDEDTLTFAWVDCPLGWCDYLELTIAEITCDKVRLWMGRVNTQVTDVEVDVYYNSAWANIYSGSFVIGSFQEFAIGSEQLVTAMRIRFFASKASRQAEIYEADFNDASLVPDISNTPSDRNFGLVAESSSYWSTVTNPPTWPLDVGDCYFTVTNNGSGSVNISIKATNFTGGDTWTLVTTVPVQNEVRLTVWESGDSEGDGINLTTSDSGFISNLAATASKKWELRLTTGTFTDGVGKTSTITLTATSA